MLEANCKNFLGVKLFAIIYSALFLSVIPIQSQAEGIFKDCPNCPEMVIIPPGNFEMGSNKSEDQAPVHQVTISKAFAMGRTAVTQGQWNAIMGNNPSNFKSCGDDCPVENVSWNDAQLFIRELNARTGEQYRLPSEAEWEYACRAGARQEYCGSNDIGSVAWYTDNSGNIPHPSSQKTPNAWGLHDMSGNIWEWVEDNWHDNYNGAPADGSAWLGGSNRRVLRSGSWYLSPPYVRAAFRSSIEPSSREYGLGFRLARSLPKP